MIRLHHCPQSRSMRPLWLLFELGVEFELAVRPFDKSLRSKEYLAVNPAGRVPALEIDGRTIWESGAITEYLCDLYPNAGLGRAVDDPERAEWLIWVHFAETISQHAAALTQQHVALYDDTMRSPVVMRLEAKRIEKCYAAIDGRLDGRDHLLDTDFSAADVSVGQAVYMARHFAHIEPFTHLTNWYTRISQRPAFVKALPQPGEAKLYLQDFFEPWDG